VARLGERIEGIGGLEPTLETVAVLAFERVLDHLGLRYLSYLLEMGLKGGLVKLSATAAPAPRRA
jgi:hypothetical protein